MKIRRLSEIDLARLASLPQGATLEQACRNYNAGGGSWSYNPVRNSTADIVGAEMPLFPAMPGTRFEQIESQIKADCTRGDNQETANVEVARVLHDEVQKRNWKAVSLPMGQLRVASREFVRYWSDIVLADESGPFVPFFDHRRGNGVSSKEIMRIVFSMQNVWIRDRIPDLADARLAIVRFPVVKEARQLSVCFHDESKLIPFEELNERIRVVYETWARVSVEKSADIRRTGTGGSTPMGF